jgi:hypothetical protein
MVGAWRFVLASGEVLPVEVTQDAAGWWHARCGRRETGNHATPQLAVWSLVRGHLGTTFDVREILEADEPTRAELVAENARLRDALDEARALVSIAAGAVRRGGAR